MDNSLSIGQYQGFFVYGETYGDFVKEHQVEFRLFIEAFDKGEFTGRIIDWNGLGADGEEAAVKGFTLNGHISFTKQYLNYHEIDEWGNKWESKDLAGHMVTYEGTLNHITHCFEGLWEIESSDHQIIFAGGTWYIKVPGDQSGSKL